MDRCIPISLVAAGVTDFLLEIRILPILKGGGNYSNGNNPKVFQKNFSGEAEYLLNLCLSSVGLWLCDARFTFSSPHDCVLSHDHT